MGGLEELDYVLVKEEVVSHTKRGMMFPTLETLSILGKDYTFLVGLVTNQQQ